MKTIVLHVNGMMCAHCQATVQKAVTAAGASDVKVDLEAKTVTCDIEAPVTEETIRTAIVEAGYEVV